MNDGSAHADGYAADRRELRDGVAEPQRHDTARVAGCDHDELVVAEPGDSLWSIAQRLAPDADPREVVDALAAARGTTAVIPGESLTWLAS